MAAPASISKPWTSRPRKAYRLENATLIDPKDGSIYHHVTLELRDGFIQRMTKLESGIDHPKEVRFSSGEDGIKTVNLAGRYILPGLIDCHVHLATPPGEDGLHDTMTQDATTALLRQPYLAHQILKRGFTTIRDCGGATLALKESLSQNLHPGPRLFIAGHAISQTGGHGDLRSAQATQPSCCNNLARIADGVPACLHAARDEIRQGADFLKIMLSGGVVSPTDRITNLQYTPEEIRAVTKVAGDSGVYVTAHAYTAAAIRVAVENGVVGIEHGNFLDEGTAQLMVDKGVFLTPTLVAYQAMASEEFRGFLPPAIAGKNLQVLEAGFKSVQIADRVGVVMCFGTDLLGPLQVKQTGEFALRRQAGLSALKCLQAATVNAARMLRMEDKLGRVKEGCFADLIILNQNPLEDITVLDRPDKHLLAVIKDGRVMESRWSKLAQEEDKSDTIE